MHDEHAIAAIDMGSNSFHMVIAQVHPEGLRPLARLKGRVRLAGGLNVHGDLTPVAQARALRCLQHFKDRLDGVPPERVRAVGTSTLRKANNAAPLLAQMQELLGVPVEVISGEREALLIYRGVAEEKAAYLGRRLVVDIGGGSTECVVGMGSRIEWARSLDVGCVSWTREFFEGGRVSQESMDQAVARARQVLSSGVDGLPSGPMGVAVGCSGTIRAVGRILERQGQGLGAITPWGLQWLRRALVEAGTVDTLVIEGLSESRAQVIAGGVAVLTAVMQELGMSALQPSRVALREGVLSELMEDLELGSRPPWLEKTKAEAVPLSA